jgi:hypothetical protein
MEQMKNIAPSELRSCLRERGGLPLPRFKKAHPALKHAAYSATTLLPGEDPVAFEKLHRALIAEWIPVGALEEHIVAEIARLMWRMQNLATFRIARLANRRCHQIEHENIPEMPPVVHPEIPSVLDEDYFNSNRAGDEALRAHEEARRQGYQIAREQAKQELGDIYELVDIGEPATLEGLMKELEVMERLDTAINKCLKQLMMVRGIKSLASNSSSAEIRALERPRKAG